MGCVYKTRSMKQRRRGVAVMVLLIAVTIAGLIGLIGIAAWGSDPLPTTTPAPVPTGAVTVAPQEAEQHFISHLRVRKIWISGYSDVDMLAVGYATCDRLRGGIQYHLTIDALAGVADNRAAAVILVDSAQSILCTDVDF